MDKLLVLAGFVHLLGFSFIVIKRAQSKHVFSLLVLFINIYCLGVLSYIMFYTSNNYTIALVNFIFSILFHFEQKIPTNRIFDNFKIAIVWITSLLSGILCFTGVGAYGIFLVQPFAFLFGFRLLMCGNNRVQLPIYLNLLISWGLAFLFLNWILIH